MKKILILVGLILLTVWASRFLDRGVLVILHNNASEAVTQIEVSSEKGEPYTIDKIDKNSSEKISVKGIEGEDLIKINYMLKTAATSSLFYVESGYKLDVYISDYGMKVDYRL